MLAAWQLLATLGIYMARFYKQAWPESMNWCDQKRWFVVRWILLAIYKKFYRSYFVTSFLIGHRHSKDLWLLKIVYTVSKKNNKKTV